MTAITDHTDRFLLVGAGPLGLALARELRREGIAFDHVDARDGVGGVWIDGVYPTVRTNSPRVMTAYPGRPMPEHWPEFPSAAQVLEYLREFAAAEGLDRDIAFGVRVTQVAPDPDERWRVAFADGRVARYRGVIASLGHNWDPQWPRLEGEFTGERIHSARYRGPAQLAGKRVLVIGLGHSGCDLAVDAAGVGACSHLSARHGRYILPRRWRGRSFMHAFPGWAPRAVQAAFVRHLYQLHLPDAAALGLPPPAQPALREANLCCNDELPALLRAGQVRIRPSATRVDGRRVYFADGTHDDYDVMLCATGFRLDFPILPERFVPMVNSKTPRLYLGAVLPEWRHLYLCGSLEPIGGFGTAGTVKARHICQLIRTQEAIQVPIGHAARALGSIPHRDNTSSYQRMRLILAFMPLLLGWLRLAERFRRRAWTSQYRTAVALWRLRRAAAETSPAASTVAR
jgi:hypothetical protein